MHQSILSPRVGETGGFHIKFGHFLVKFFTQGGKTDVKYPFPEGKYILLDLRWYKLV